MSAARSSLRISIDRGLVIRWRLERSAGHEPLEQGLRANTRFLCELAKRNTLEPGGPEEPSPEQRVTCPQGKPFSGWVYRDEMIGCGDFRERLTRSGDYVRCERPDAAEWELVPDMIVEISEPKVLGKPKPPNDRPLHGSASENRLKPGREKRSILLRIHSQS
jgi:hypothetical protein